MFVNKHFAYLTLCEKCPYSEFFWYVFSSIWTKYREILCIFPYSVLMRENTDQKNSEYGHFSRSVKCTKKVKGVIMYNLRNTIFYMKTNVLQDLHICISVPLKLFGPYQEQLGFFKLPVQLF